MQMESERKNAHTVATGMEIHFPDGIPAFEDVQNFVLVGSEEIEPFVMLVSKDAEDFRFFCIDPCLLMSDYDVRLTEEDRRRLKLTDHEDAVALAFVTRAKAPQDFTANLLAPLIINVRNRLAKQVIAEKYPVRFNIWEAVQRNEVEQCEEG